MFVSRLESISMVTKEYEQMNIIEQQLEQQQQFRIRCDDYFIS